jgi:hypothetical protein
MSLSTKQGRDGFYVLCDIIEDFHAHIKVERGLAPRTVEGYRSWLRNYHRFLTESGYEQPTLDDFCLLTLRKYLYHLTSGKRRPRTLRSLFTLFGHLGPIWLSKGRSRRILPTRYACPNWTPHVETLLPTMRFAHYFPRANAKPARSALRCHGHYCRFSVCGSTTAGMHRPATG